MVPELVERLVQFMYFSIHGFVFRSESVQVRDVARAHASFASEQYEKVDGVVFYVLEADAVVMARHAKEGFE